MGVKTHRPTTATMRHQVTPDFKELTTNKPFKRLTVIRKRTGGRNSYGRITIRFRGGGHKRLYRLVDFYRRDKEGVEATVKTIEYDPNRSSRIALLLYGDGEHRYILWPEGLGVGDTILASPDADIKIGNALPLRRIPTGQAIHGVGLNKNGGAKIVRSAGSSAVIQAKEGDYAHVKLPSGEIRLIHLDCWATIGQLGNIDHKNLVAGKAGRNRWRGRRPHVRGVAMNPVDHPHGGGEGKSGHGGHPVSPWGKHTKGRRTRSPKKYSNRWIVKRRAP